MEGRGERWLLGSGNFIKEEGGKKKNRKTGKGVNREEDSVWRRGWMEEERQRKIIEED